jgi:hypothetical protein
MERPHYQIPDVVIRAHRQSKFIKLCRDVPGCLKNSHYRANPNPRARGGANVPRARSRCQRRIAGTWEIELLKEREMPENMELAEGFEPPTL